MAVQGLDVGPLTFCRSGPLVALPSRSAAKVAGSWLTRGLTTTADKDVTRVAELGIADQPHRHGGGGGGRVRRVGRQPQTHRRRNRRPRRGTSTPHHQGRGARRRDAEERSAARREDRKSVV